MGLDLVIPEVPSRTDFQGFNGFPGGSEVKASAFSAGDLGSIPGLGISPKEGNGYPLQYSILKNSMDREAWRATHFHFLLASISKVCPKNML